MQIPSETRVITLDPQSEDGIRRWAEENGGRVIALSEIGVSESATLLDPMTFAPRTADARISAIFEATLRSSRESGVTLLP